MSKLHKTSVRLAALLLMASTLMAFVGCGNKDDKPSAPGYYDGPVTPKTEIMGKPGGGGGAGGATGTPAESGK
jgi:hypothetical protein